MWQAVGNYDHVLIQELLKEETDKMVGGYDVQAQVLELVGNSNVPQVAQVLELVDNNDALLMAQAHVDGGNSVHKVRVYDGHNDVPVAQVQVHDTDHNKVHVPLAAQAHVDDDNDVPLVAEVHVDDDIDVPLVAEVRVYDRDHVPLVVHAHLDEYNDNPLVAKVEVYDRDHNKVHSPLVAQAHVDDDNDVPLVVEVRVGDNDCAH